MAVLTTDGIVDAAKLSAMLRNFHQNGLLRKALPGLRGIVQKAKDHDYLFTSANGTPWDMNVHRRRKLHPLLKSLEISRQLQIWPPTPEVRRPVSPELGALPNLPIRDNKFWPYREEFESPERRAKMPPVSLKRHCSI